MRWTKRLTIAAASVAAVLLLGSAFLPTLCRSRETANRVKCASNLRQIGQAIQIYARANGGAFPDAFATLVLNSDLVPEVFTCPSGPAERADSLATLAGAPTDDNLSYVYVGDRLSAATVDVEDVVMFEGLNNHDEDGMNILFGDGHIEFINYSRRKPPAWHAAVQAQIKAGTRPVRLVPTSTTRASQ